ncbi:MAG TPA: thioredoxin family protein [Burkholderiaceae bacterium]|nr:thioredoxin family protein [Burkholderiaceae bacterium]
MASVHIACLCAAWCRLCDEYRPMLQALAAEFTRAGVRAHWHWVDIEDEADLLGELDVETFPTLVIADDAQVRFAGPVTPQRDTLQRLLRATVLEAAPDARWPRAEPAVQAFAAALRRRAPDGFATAPSPSAESE